ncbi:hypothetical protein [Solibacillus isronensis]|uniref:hypothetical protein n=1 Tax=Solibacillus isronensis TaxID=412383 RepID=UPI00203C4183|nr:hypothetical protein [Solibacillus isronensis]MCM3723966.1 hypothetical protein [Solibacillus isronensis]
MTRPFVLTFKNGENLEIAQNVFLLTESQRDELINYAKLFTKQELLGSQSGIKIKMATEQMKQVISYKDKLLKGYDGKQALEDDLIEFKEHAFDRIYERFFNSDEIEFDELLVKLIDVLINSSEVHEKFEWKGYSNLSFSFRGLDFNLGFDTITIVSALTKDTAIIITGFKKSFKNALGIKIKKPTI